MSSATTLNTLPAGVRRLQWLVGLSFLAIWIAGPIVAYHWYATRHELITARRQVRVCGDDARCVASAWNAVLREREDDAEALTGRCKANGQLGEPRTVLATCIPVLPMLEQQEAQGAGAHADLSAALEHIAVAYDVLGDTKNFLITVDALLPRPNVDVTRWATHRATVVSRQDQAAALLDLTRAIQVHTSSPNEAHQLREQILVAAGRTHASLPDLDALLAGNPGNTDLLLKRARIFIAQGLLTLARHDLAVLKPLRPRDPEVIVTIGDVELANGKWKPAADAFRQLMKIDEKSFAARAGLAHAFVLVGQGSEALSLMRSIDDGRLDPLTLLRLALGEQALCDVSKTKRWCDARTRQRMRDHMARFVMQSGDDPRRSALETYLAAKPVAPVPSLVR